MITSEYNKICETCKEVFSNCNIIDISIKGDDVIMKYKTKKSAEFIKVSNGLFESFNKINFGHPA